MRVATILAACLHVLQNEREVWRGAHGEGRVDAGVPKVDVFPRSTLTASARSAILLSRGEGWNFCQVSCGGNCRRSARFIILPTTATAWFMRNFLLPIPG